MTIIEAIQGDALSLDYSSYRVLVGWGRGISAAILMTWTAPKDPKPLNPKP